MMLAIILTSEPWLARYFDLSGNKRHIVPVGDDFDMASPNTMNGSDDDVPVPNNIPNNRPGSLEILPVRIMVALLP